MISSEDIDIESGAGEHKDQHAKKQAPETAEGNRCSSASTQSSTKEEGDDCLETKKELGYEDPDKAAAEAKRAAADNKPKSDVTQLFKGVYSERECYFVIFIGVCLAFNSGYVNGACLSGLLTPHAVRQSVAGFTGAYTTSALSVAAGDTGHFWFQLCMILSFIFGSFIAGAMTPRPTAFRIEPTYGPTFVLGGVFLIVSSVLAALEHDESYFFFCAAAANGIQNGITSIYSANLIRSTHLTGTSTDIGLFLGQAVRGNYKNSWKLIVLLCLAVAFWFGGLVSYFATSRYTSVSLLFNAGLFLLIGCLLVFFLMQELHVSFTAAMLGTWQWKRAFEKLHQSFIEEVSGSLAMSNHLGGKSLSLMQLFDMVDADGSGTIEEHELFDALTEAGVKVKRREIKAMVRHADTDRDGKIDRDEWMQIALACQGSAN